MIHGMVERPLVLTMEELQRLPSQCASISWSAPATAATAGRRRRGPQCKGRTASPAAANGPASNCRCCSTSRGPARRIMDRRGRRSREDDPQRPAGQGARRCNDRVRRTETIRPEQGFPSGCSCPVTRATPTSSGCAGWKVVDKPYRRVRDVEKYRPHGRWQRASIHADGCEVGRDASPAGDASPARLSRNRRASPGPAEGSDARRGVRRRRPGLEGRYAAGADPASRAHAFPPAVGVGRPGNRRGVA